MLAFRATRVARTALPAAVALLVLATACASPSLPYHKSSVHRGPAPSRADLFMRSVEVRDGALGWHQLCPDLQSQIPESAVMSAASTQKAAEAGQVKSLRSEPLGTRNLKSGEQIRLYLLTAELAGGAQAMRLYVLHTRAGGCVHAVQTEDVQ
jgi:hypothetical protein